MEATINIASNGTDFESWDDWRWHMKNSVTTLGQLENWVNVTAEEGDAIEAVKGKYLWRISPYYASLMDRNDPSCPIRLQAVPSTLELEKCSGSDVDPVADASFRKTNRVIHKYPDRVVFLVTSVCPVYCRHCTRKYHTTDVAGTYFGESEGASMDPDLSTSKQIRKSAMWFCRAAIH
ncbi:hypothetical protein AWV80_17450 [Cupriavidus sp. UYMU48A]|nr:hypothetical protein AWV80_17450 [Cupriavidus sp. UYMU48A]